MSFWALLPDKLILRYKKIIIKIMIICRVPKFSHTRNFIFLHIICSPGFTDSKSAIINQCLRPKLWHKRDPYLKK
jgi:hypothetical protein